jgi:hypothetical protein
METIFQQKHIETRQIRKAFMRAMIQEGQVIIERLKAERPELYCALQNRFKTQPARAAFWLVSERDPKTFTTPLQKLANGMDEDFILQLKSPSMSRGFIT